MKKINIKRRLLSVALASIAFLLCLISIITAGQALAQEETPKPAPAAENMSEEEIKKELEDNVLKNLDGIDFSELDKWAASLGENTVFSQGIKELIVKITNGEYSAGFSDFFDLAISALTGGIKSFLPAFIAIFAISVLLSMMQGLSSGFLRNNTQELVHFACYGAVIIILAVQITSVIVNVTRTIEAMSSLMQAVFPILLTLITALGSTSAAGIYQPLMAVLSTTIGSIISSIILPCFVATVIFSIVGNISSQIRLGRLTKFFKSSASYVLAGIFSLFAGFLAIQGVTGGFADSVSVRTAKFAIQSYVPILGGYLSDGFDLVLTSVILIKNSLGLISVLMIFTLVIAPVMQVAVFTLGLKLVAGLCEPISRDKRISDLLYSVSKNTSLLIAAIAGMTFMFLITVTLLIGTCNAGVL